MTRKKPAPARPAPARKSPPPAPGPELMTAAEFDAALALLITQASGHFAKRNGDRWADVANGLERLRTVVRDMAADKERARGR